ncbi:hypothetical protein SOVF_138560, partial [Spinacia oleracea]
MADSIVSDLVGRLLGYLGQSAAGKVASYFGGRDKLKELEHTMMMIQARLSDAERLCEGEDGALVKLWLKRLKNVLYQFEDLFEEVSFYDKDMELRSANSLTNAGSTSSLNKTISSLMFLRALDLGEGFYKRLPNSIGELKHLRYLRVCVLSTSLPFGITRLQNLQTLDLRNSQNLIKMPRDFYKLSSLRNLQLRCCMQNVNGDIWIDSGGFVDMPRRFGQLASLETLDYFIVGKNNGLDALSRLNLVGGCQIYFKKRRQNMRAEAMLANLKEKKLTFLKLNWSFLHDIGAGEVIECLQPPCTLKAFHIQEWKGVGFPSWGIDEIPCLLPNLVSITIEGCIRCQYLPTFSQLPHLKMLDLLVLHALEYIEIGVESSSSSVGFSCSRATTYFPALERLHLRDLPKLKSWSTTESIGDNISSVTPGVSQVLNSLRELVLGRLPNAELLPRSFGCSTMLQQLNIRELPNLESLPEGIGNLSQLYKLCIGDCPKLIALPESF